MPLAGYSIFFIAIDGFLHAEGVRSAAICTVEWRCRVVRRCISHTTKADMVRTRADLAFTTRANHVARTISIRAQERSASHYSLGLARFGWIKRGRWTARIASHYARRKKLLVVVRTIP